MNQLKFLSNLAISGIVGVIGTIGFQASTQAISITPTTDVDELINALIAGNSGITNVSATLNGHSLLTGEVSTGIFTNVTKTYNGIGFPDGGIVISTGDVADYADGPNISGSTSTSYGVPATPAQEALLDPLVGVDPPFPHFDVTQLDITFDMMPGEDTVFFDLVFGSEEFFEFVGSDFIDTFGLYVNGTNIAFANGEPININNPGALAISGTELDGVITESGNPVLSFSQFVGDGSTNNTLTFIIGDASDEIYDATTYVANLGANDPNGVPEPSTILGLLAISGLGNHKIV